MVSKFLQNFANVCLGANQIFQFLDGGHLYKGYGKVGYSQLNHSQCVSFGGKIRNFISSGFCDFVP